MGVRGTREGTSGTPPLWLSPTSERIKGSRRAPAKKVSSNNAASTLWRLGGAYSWQRAIQEESVNTEEETRRDRASETDCRAKDAKQYKSPRLMSYGSLTELTRSGGSEGDYDIYANTKPAAF